MTILERVRIRVQDEETAPDETLQNLIDTVTDRLNLRLGTEYLPRLFETICADATVKLYRRQYYEGISSEGVANISTSFVEDILGEYEAEIDNWKNSNSDEEGMAGKVVRFL